MRCPIAPSPGTGAWLADQPAPDGPVAGAGVTGLTISGEALAESVGAGTTEAAAVPSPQLPQNRSPAPIGRPQFPQIPFIYPVPLHSHPASPRAAPGIRSVAVGGLPAE